MIKEQKSFLIKCDHCGREMLISDGHYSTIESLNYKLEKLGWNKLYNGWLVCEECNKRIQLSPIKITVDGIEHDFLDYCLKH